MIERKFCTYCNSITPQTFIYATDKWHTREIVFKKNMEELGESAYTIVNIKESVFKCNVCERLHIYYIETIPTKDNNYESLEYSQPKKITRKQPEWIKNINIKYLKLIGEIYSSYNNKNFILFSIGCRTLLDKYLTEVLGDIGGFEKKLKQYKLDGHINNKQFDILKLLIESGNASAHRAFEPNEELSKVLIEIIETILHENILEKKVKLHITSIPSR